MTERADESGHTVRVAAAPGHSETYDVLVRAGALAGLPALLAGAAAAHRYAVIAPRDVAALHGEALTDALLAEGLRADLLTFEPGESSKTRATWASLTDRMFQLGFGRDSCVVAVGGGVTGDLAGFVAATYMRGIPIVQVPTTLLAMIDASVGGKTGVDTAAGKNLVGAFHSPALVVADPLVLRSLPLAALRAGLSEAVKHGVMLDAEYFEWIDDNAPALQEYDPAALERLIVRSVQLKAAVAGEDPFEMGRRAVLNYGHTVGHALEQQAGYTMDHGFAVAAGMVVEATAGEAAGITSAGTADRVAALLRRCELPAAPPPTVVAELLPAMALDKKARHAEPRFALPNRVGSAARAADGGWTHTIPEPTLTAAFDAVSRAVRSV